MYRLAKLGFTQSYTYFAWRNTAYELVQYFTDCRSRRSVNTSGEPVAEHPGHPDRVPCKNGGRPAFANAPHMARP